MNQFEAAIETLWMPINACGLSTCEVCLERRAAIRILESWSKWKPLIEAAGKVDKGRAVNAVEDAIIGGRDQGGSDVYMAGLTESLTLACALPEPEDERK